MAGRGSRDLEDEEAELGADDEEGEEPGNTPEKEEGKVLPSSLSDDMMTQDEMDFSEPNDLNLSCKTSPQR